MKSDNHVNIISQSTVNGIICLWKAVIQILINHIHIAMKREKMQTIQEKIKQRRRQMLVHSYIYYELNQNIVSDHKWAEWAKELQELQQKYPKESAEVEYYEDFKDWDGSSGAFLKFGENIKTVAKILLEQNNCSNQHINPVFAKNMQKTSSKPLKSKVKSSTRSLF